MENNIRVITILQSNHKISENGLESELKEIQNNLNNVSPPKPSLIKETANQTTHTLLTKSNTTRDAKTRRIAQKVEMERQRNRACCQVELN